MPNSGVYEIEFDPDGDAVRMEVFIGQAQLGTYTVSERDDQGQFLQDVADGNNIDNLPDEFDIPTASANLNGHYANWNIIVASPDESPGQLYFTRVTFKQDNKNLPGSPIEQNGSFDGQKILLGFAHFNAV